MSSPHDPQVTEGRKAQERRSSARLRILGWYVVLLGVSLIAALFLQRALLLREAVSGAEESLDQEIGELSQLAGGIDPETGEPFGDDVAAIFDTFFNRNVPLEGEGVVTFVAGEIYKTDVTGNLVARLPEARRWAEITEPERGDLTDPDLGDIVYLAVPLVSDGQSSGGVFVVSILLEGRFATINDTMRLGAVVFGTVFILASVAAWVIAGRILRPLSDLRDTAQSISDTDLSRRIDVRGDDEIAELGRTFNSMLDRLDDAFATQRRFIDDAGHELRTPITVIRGNLEVMGDEPEERAESIALVTRELDRMTRIVNDLLDLAKSEQPDFIQPAPVDLADFIHDVVRRASTLDDRPWKVERADHAVIEADEDRLAQAMMNLVRNAVEHTANGSPVYLGGRLGWSTATLWVRDEGEALSEGDRARVFDRFARVGSGARSTSGAGLGLSIVAAIAEAHGGGVTVDEAREGGNIFTITIPASSNLDLS